MNTEEMREEYKPKKVKLLLVGESPPKDGVFFYGSSQKCQMTTYTSQAFELAFNEKFKNIQEFLQFFKDKNCFLDDLCTEPVDKEDNNARNKKLQKSIPTFANKLRKINPEIIVIALMKIEQYVASAIKISKMNSQPTVYTLPFAGYGHQKKFKNKFVKILGKYYLKHNKH